MLERDPSTCRTHITILQRSAPTSQRGFQQGNAYPLHDAPALLHPGWSAGAGKPQIQLLSGESTTGTNAV